MHQSSAGECQRDSEGAQRPQVWQVRLCFSAPQHRIELTFASFVRLISEPDHPYNLTGNLRLLDDSESPCCVIHPARKSLETVLKERNAEIPFTLIVDDQIGGGEGFNSGCDLKVTSLYLSGPVLQLAYEMSGV